MAKKGFRILIGYRRRHFKLASLRLNDNDGSFYINLTRAGASSVHWTYEAVGARFVTQLKELTESTRVKGVGVSYHASGLVRYKNVSNKSIFGEPLTQVTKPFGFARYSVPSIDRLDERQATRTSDFIFPLPDALAGRVTFNFFASPLATPLVTAGGNVPVPNSELGLNIHFPDLFSVNCVVDQETLAIPPELGESFVFMSPSTGPFPEPLLSMDQAAVHFHQLLTGSNGVIVYPPDPTTGVYLMIFAVEMRVPPEITIKLADSHQRIEIVERTRGSARFKVKDRYGHVLKSAVQIAEVILDAEL